MPSENDVASLSERQPRAEGSASRLTGPPTARRVAVNTGVQLMARVVGAGTGLVQTAIMSHYLHSRGFGQFGFIASVIALCGILGEMGVNSVTIRSLNQKGIPFRPQTLGGMLVARAFLTALAVTASDVFALATPLDPVVRGGIVLMSAVYLLTIPGQFVAVFQAELELQFPIMVNIVQMIIGLGAVIGLIQLHASLLQLVGAQVVLLTLSAWSTCLIAFRRYKLRIEPSLSMGLRMAREAFPVGIGLVLVTVYYRIDMILLGLLHGNIDVANYSAAYKFIDLATFAATAFIGSIYPWMVRSGAEADRAMLLRTYQLSTDIMLATALPITIAWFILARPIIFLVYPADFMPAVDALRILSWVLVPLFFNSVLGAMVLTLHREKMFLWISLGAAILNITLNLAFIPKYGITAASVITVISELFVMIVAVYVMWRDLRFVPSLRIAGCALGASLVMAVPLYVFRQEWVGAAVIGSLVYLGITRALRLWSWTMVCQAMGPRSAGWRSL